MQIIIEEEMIQQASSFAKQGATRNRKNMHFLRRSVICSISKANKLTEVLTLILWPRKPNTNLILILSRCRDN